MYVDFKLKFSYLSISTEQFTYHNNTYTIWLPSWCQVIVPLFTNMTVCVEYYLTPSEHIFSYIMTKTSHSRSDDDVRIVLDQHTYLEFYSTSSLKHQSTSRHVAPHGHKIPLPRQPVFVFVLDDVCLAEKQKISVLLSLVSSDRIHDLPHFRQAR